MRHDTRLTDRLPPQSYFTVSAVFHYLGPSLAVLLFAQVSVLGVAWLRIVTAAVVFAAWRRPWRMVRRLDRRQRWVLVQLGVVLAAMNSLFYLAVERLPLATVGAIEFLGTVLLAALGVRTRRNALALLLTTGGVAAITEIRLAGQPLGFVFAFGNCVLFMLYVILGHRIANTGKPGLVGGGDRARAWQAGGAPPESGDGEFASDGGTPAPAPESRLNSIDQLGASMLIAAVAVTPFTLGSALPAFSQPVLVLAGAGVGICSSVIPYITDQLAMARLPRATFALMLALLPMFAVVIGAIVLHQIPTAQDLAGIALVVAGVALHQAELGQSERGRVGARRDRATAAGPGGTGRRRRGQAAPGDGGGARRHRATAARPGGTGRRRRGQSERGGGARRPLWRPRPVPARNQRRHAGQVVKVGRAELPR
jgi:inner membrane transporter RhtA